MNRFSDHHWYRALGALIGVAAIVTGCSSIPAPTEQIAVSKSAIANAVSAGGSEYAPVELRSAQDKMDRAMRAMEKEDYDTARALAEQAQADARLAEKMAQSAKAQKSAGVMQDDIRVLREEIDRKNK
jgi:hypothetical protein